VTTVHTIEAGDRVESEFFVGSAQVGQFSDLSGDRNPIHVDRDAARAHGFPRAVAHGGILIAEVSRVIGCELPGAGSLWVSSEFEFLRPVYVGTQLRLAAEVQHVSPAFGLAVLKFEAVSADSETLVFKGSATVKLLSPQTPMNSVPLGSQTIIVSGGTRGIGAAVSRGALRLGASVIALYRSDEEQASAFANEVDDEPGSVRTVRCDVTSAADVADLFSELGDQPVHGVVHAASPTFDDVAVADLAWGHFSGLLETYVSGAVSLVQGSRERFKTHGAGRVVFLGSEVTMQPKAGWTHYVTAKAALAGLARGLAVDLAVDGTTVNVVSPGAVHTSDQFAPGAKSMIRSATPLNRLVTEEEIAEVVLFLLGPGGSFMTGVDLPLSGGRVFG